MLVVVLFGLLLGRRRRRRAATRARRSELTTRRPAWRSRCAGVSARSMCASARASTRRAVAARVGGCWLDAVDERRRERGRVGASGESTRPVERARSRTAGTACRRRTRARAAAAAAPRSARGAASAARRRAGRLALHAARHQRRVVGGGRRRVRERDGPAALWLRSGRGFEVRKVGGRLFELFGFRNCYWRVHAATRVGADPHQNRMGRCVRHCRRVGCCVCRQFTSAQRRLGIAQGPSEGPASAIISCGSGS